MKAFQNILDRVVLTAVVRPDSSRSIHAPEEMASPPLIKHAALESAHDCVLARNESRPRATRKLLKWWIVAIIVLLTLSAGIILASWFFWGSYKPGIVVSVIIWAPFFSICALYSLQQKFITGTFGTVLGISANEFASGGAGLIAKANSSIKDIAVQVGLIIDPNQDSVFIGRCIWIFLILFVLFCLPAFFLNERLDTNGS